MSHAQGTAQQGAVEWVRVGDLRRAMSDMTARAGTMSAAFAMAVALALPWMHRPDSTAVQDDRLLFALTHTFENRWELQDAAFLRVAALVAVAATVVCLVGSWRRWHPGTVSLAPGAAVLVLVAALAYVDLFTAHISGDVGFYLALVIQLGLYLTWRNCARR